MSKDAVTFLKMLQLCDSAVPIGAASHSFGLETLTDDETLTVDGLEAYLRAYLREAGALEAAFCRTAYRLASAPDQEFADRWPRLNAEVSAVRPARESRTASVTLGRRFLQLAASLTGDARIAAALRECKDAHHCIAFGYVGGLLDFGEEATTAAYLNQSVMGLVSACQRLMPLGQQRASMLLWAVKPDIAAAAAHADTESVTCFTPLLDLGSMRHPTLMTRLFIS
jgi:urease accessory protein